MGLVKFFCMCILLAMLGDACGYNTLQQELDNHIEQFKLYQHQVSLDQNALVINQTKQIRDLKNELDNSMEEKVTKALDKILSGEMYRDIIKLKVDKEVTHLRKSHTQMKQKVVKMTRELKQIKSTLAVVQDENVKIRKSFEKEPRCQCKTGEVSKPTRTSNHSSVTAKTTSTYPVSSTVPSTTITGPRLTSPAPEDTNNIFVMTKWHPLKHHPRLVNIHSNAVSIYSYLNLKQVTTVVYISKLNSLFIGLRFPHKIISSELNSSSIKTIKHNVETYGMAVDDKLSTVFLSTHEPDSTISRMGLDGGEFSTVVSLSRDSNSPRAIAVDTNTEIIYTCNYHHLLSVRYNGSGLTTLNTGSYIYAVTLDIINGVLYYGDRYKLMKLSLDRNTSTEVARLTDRMWNLVYYRDTVYYMSWYGILGSVDVGQNNVVNTLQTEPVSGVGGYSICLIP